MKELIKYLLDNLYIDFQGEITLETVRGFLRDDDGREDYRRHTAPLPSVARAARRSWGRGEATRRARPSGHRSLLS